MGSDEDGKPAETALAGVSRPEMADAGQPAVLQTENLFRGAREVVIAHRGDRYRLRITQSGKLILTK